MTYTTYFDASAHPVHDWSWLLIGGLITLVGAVMAFRPKLIERLGFGFRNVSARPIFRWTSFLFGACWLLIACATIFSDALRASAKVRKNECSIVEGRVADFHPMPPAGHDTERFEVNGVPFSYSDYIITSGFNQSASHGGPIREGLPVRICYADGEILRLEVGH